MCQAAVGLVGDLCRCIGEQIFDYCDDIMAIMVDTLSVNILMFNNNCYIKCSL